MSKKDEQRWRDWRASNGQALRRVPVCQACGSEFWLLVSNQQLCHECAWAEVQAAVPVTADEIDRLDIERQLRSLPLRESEPPRPTPLGDYHRLARRADALARRLAHLPSPPARRPAPTSSPAGWLPIARRKAKQGWSHRKIAAFLGLPRKEVSYWLSLRDGDAERFLLACQGKVTKPAAPATDPRLLWCYAKHESACRLCGGRILRGDRMVRVEERWVHAKCATQQGYELVELDRRSRVQERLDRLSTTRAGA